MKTNEMERGANDLLCMEEAIELLKTTRPTFYRWLRSGKLKGMKVGRQWRFRRADILNFLGGKEPTIDLAADPGPFLECLLKELKEAGEKMPDLDPQDQPVVRLVNLMIRLALTRRASDIHLAPQFFEENSEWRLVLRLRIDGVLTSVFEGDLRLLAPILERWKGMSALSVHEMSLPQDGRILIRVDERRVDIRVSCVPTICGESFVGRILLIPEIPAPGALGFHPEAAARLKEACRATHGLVIVNGSIGSGKTSTLYSCLKEIANPKLKTMTVEHPVELALPWMTQLMVVPEKGITFPALIKSCLRQDPDVLMVGEVRDLDTLKLCATSALTGHLVFTSLHAPDSAHALKRMIELGLEPFLVGDSTRLVFSQRLVRRLCPQCSAPATPTEAQRDRINQTLAEIPGMKEKPAKDFRVPVGCPACQKMGYRGRVPVAEALKMSSAIYAGLTGGKSAAEIRKIAIDEGMVPLAGDALHKAANGVIDLEQFLSLLSPQG